MFSFIAAWRAAAIRKRPAMLGAFAVLFLGVSGCGSDGGGTTGPSGGKVTGTYVLEYVDDDEPPVAVHRGPWLDPATGVFYNNFVLQVTAGYLELRENESFYLALQIRIDGDGRVVETMMELEGEWDEVKDQIVLRVQFPLIGTQILERDGSWLTTDMDFLGLGEMTELDFKR